MYGVIRQRLDWQLNDSRIYWTNLGYIVRPSRRILARDTWASIAAHSIQAAGYRAELLDEAHDGPAVRVSL